MAGFKWDVISGFLGESHVYDWLLNHFCTLKCISLCSSCLKLMDMTLHITVHLSFTPKGLLSVPGCAIRGYDKTMIPDKVGKWLLLYTM